MPTHRNFRAEAVEGVVEWHANAPHLVGTPDLVDRVQAVLSARRSILLTPTGPSVPAVATNPAGVFAALLSLGLFFEFSGAVPRVPSVPVGAAA